MFDATQNVYHIVQPELPHLRFEWHPDCKRVYAIRKGPPMDFAEPFAFEIENSGAAHNTVLIYLRGYRAAEAEYNCPTKDEQMERSLYVGIG